MRPALIKSAQWHFHQDNVPVHNSILVTDYLTKLGIKTVPQPPSSPDLAPCDFWLFPKLKGCCYCSQRRLLWRGQEFHVCTINKSALMKNAYIYIYIYITISHIKYSYLHFSFFFILNWITMTRKCGEHLHMTYGNTGQLFWPY